MTKTVRLLFTCMQGTSRLFVCFLVCFCSVFVTTYFKVLFVIVSSRLAMDRHPGYSVEVFTRAPRGLGMPRTRKRKTKTAFRAGHNKDSKGEQRKASGTQENGQRKRIKPHSCKVKQKVLLKGKYRGDFDLLC